MWFDFLYKLSAIFLIPRRTERDVIINLRRSLCKVPHMSQIFMKIESSQQIFEKYLCQIS
jgi:hypothetical protein